MTKRNALHPPLLILFVLLLIAVIPCAAIGDEAVPAEPELRWWKGNIHTHTLWSDGNDFPDMIAEWYRSRGYNFLALTDHNVLSEGQRWMKHGDIVRRGGKDALAKYQARFGGGWVETRGEAGAASFEVRLKPLNEFRALVEERGKFIMIQGEEISDRSEDKPVHMNATNIKRVIQPLGGATVREAMANNLRAVQEQAEREGREILLHLNHPNFGLAITAEDLAAVVEERFFEVYNGHPGVKQLGEEGHPSVERIWDIANTIRLAGLEAPPLFGVATDDSHYYHGRPGSRPGRGWIMVRARYLTPERMIRAIKGGDFYASSGVELKHVSFESSIIKIEIKPEEGVTYKTEFIGTLAGDGDSAKATPTAANIGRVLATDDSLKPSHRLTGKELYVRAVITASKPHPDPSFENQFEQAWTQPVGWEPRLKAR